jgi:hypothetical protein
VIAAFEGGRIGERIISGANGPAVAIVFDENPTMVIERP